MNQAKWKNQDTSLPESTGEKLALEFETGIYESLLKADPENVEALFNLGDVYTRRGLYCEGLSIDKKLVALLPDNAVARYNLACSYSRLGELDLTFEALEKAVALGYAEFDFMKEDPDLENARRDPRFDDLLAKHVGSPSNQTESEEESD
jgi:tetratricopeptide (TPR) repeat protein